VWDWLGLLLLCLLLAVREHQHHKLVLSLLDRLMSKEGFEPVSEIPEEESPVKQQVEQMAGGVRIKIPMPNSGIRMKRGD
jgi:hypothetical protein